jgi:GntR family transcriptional repressor for pyruvate dehydrogenase complex
MATQFGVSRTVIREAVGALTSRGALVVRPGAGVFVSQIDASAATESLAMLLHASAERSYEKVHEVREAIEPSVAALAAIRATGEDVREIRLALVAQESAVTGEAFAIADAKFHLALVVGTHNELFGVILEAIGDIMMEVRRQTAYLPGSRRQVTLDHRQIAEAVVHHDAPAAMRAMEEHLANSRAIVLQLDDALRQSRTGALDGPTESAGV